MKKREDVVNKHKFWLIFPIAVVVIAVAFLVLYSPVREALFGKAITKYKPDKPFLLLYSPARETLLGKAIIKYKLYTKYKPYNKPVFKVINKSINTTTIYPCTGTIPSNAQLCPGDGTGLRVYTPRKLVPNCTTTTKCEYTCLSGYQLQEGVCRLIPLAPSVCGNARLEAGEQCDPPSSSFYPGANTGQCDFAGTPGYTCSDTCQCLAYCGNNIIETNEQCDDGNKVNGDGCSGNCRME